MTTKKVHNKISQWRLRYIHFSSIDRDRMRTYIIIVVWALEQVEGKNSEAHHLHISQLPLSQMPVPFQVTKKIILADPLGHGNW
jgi:hypothetical protein